MTLDLKTEIGLLHINLTVFKQLKNTTEFVHKINHHKRI